MIHDKIYTVEALSETLKISDRTLRRLLGNGTIKGVKKCGRWLIKHSDVVVWLESK